VKVKVKLFLRLQFTECDAKSVQALPHYYIVHLYSPSNNKIVSNAPRPASRKRGRERGRRKGAEERGKDGDGMKGDGRGGKRWRGKYRTLQTLLRP